MLMTRKPKLAVWKFASCDGCQLSLLDCEDELLAVAGAVEIAYFPEATRAVVKGPYDVSLVEGSVTTPHDAERLHDVRRQSRTLITIGACATAGGIQALRNFKDVREFTAIVYARPDYIETLATSTPISAHVNVDFELRGCPSTSISCWRCSPPTCTSASRDSAALRLRGVQSARHRLRAGARRGILPGAGDACRLRCDLSRLQPRVLRLLRPEGNAQHRGAQRAPARRRHERTRSPTGVPHLNATAEAFREESDRHGT